MASRRQVAAWIHALEKPPSLAGPGDPSLRGTRLLEGSLSANRPHRCGGQTLASRAQSRGAPVVESEALSGRDGCSGIEVEAIGTRR